LTDWEITREHGASKGRYVLHRDGAEAELTYSIASPHLIIADHTGVPDALRGTGAGLALAQRMVDDARAQGFRIIALCPFVAAQLRRHPEWQEVFQT